eukprot:TRINITY_DN49894_c0_g1_i1.p1 TRINITY_DN49894_c0_g1~~TRINITY_DN49894_c0_g1_i1.p1  ORF type:complete len:109 (+),score=1.83 TRINITY_DN49894_c0_g1_i1:3-329(+)
MLVHREWEPPPIRKPYTRPIKRHPTLHQASLVDTRDLDSCNWNVMGSMDAEKTYQPIKAVVCSFLVAILPILTLQTNKIQPPPSEGAIAFTATVELVNGDNAQCLRST